MKLVSKVKDPEDLSTFRVMSCFFCSQIFGALGSDILNQTQPFTLRHISRFLKIFENDDEEKVSEDLKSKLYKFANDSAVFICQDCSKMMKEFQELYHLMEVTKLRLNGCVQRMQHVMVMTKPKGKTGIHADGHDMNLFETLRSKMIDRMKTIISQSQPRVVLHKAKPHMAAIHEEETPANIPSRSNFRRSRKSPQNSNIISNKNSAKRFSGKPKPNNLKTNEEEYDTLSKPVAVAPARATTFSVCQHPREKVSENYLNCSLCRFQLPITLKGANGQLHRHILANHCEKFFPMQEYKLDHVTVPEYKKIVNELLFKDFINGKETCPFCEAKFIRRGDRDRVVRIMSHFIEFHFVEIKERLKLIQQDSDLPKKLEDCNPEGKLCQCGVYIFNLENQKKHEKLYCRLTKDNPDNQCEGSKIENSPEVNLACPYCRFSLLYCSDFSAAKFTTHLITFHPEHYFTEIMDQFPNLTKDQFQRIIHHILFPELLPDSNTCQLLCQTRFKTQIFLKDHLLRFHRNELKDRLRMILSDSNMLENLNNFNGEGISCLCGMYLPKILNQCYHDRFHCKLKAVNDDDSRLPSTSSGSQDHNHDHDTLNKEGNGNDDQLKINGIPSTSTTIPMNDNEVNRHEQSLEKVTFLHSINGEERQRSVSPSPLPKSRVAPNDPGESYDVKVNIKAGKMDLPTDKMDIDGNKMSTSCTYCRSLINGPQNHHQILLTMHLLSFHPHHFFLDVNEWEEKHLTNDQFQRVIHNILLPEFVTRNKPFKCQLLKCQDEFGNQTYLKNHLVRHHGIEMKYRLRMILNDDNLLEKLNSLQGLGKSCPCGMYIPLRDDAASSQIYHDSFHCKLKTPNNSANDDHLPSTSKVEEEEEDEIHGRPLKKMKFSEKSNDASSLFSHLESATTPSPENPRKRFNIEINEGESISPLGKNEEKVPRPISVNVTSASICNTQNQKNFVELSPLPISSCPNCRYECSTKKKVSLSINRHLLWFHPQHFFHNFDYQVLGVTDDQFQRAIQDILFSQLVPSGKEKKLALACSFCKKTFRGKDRYARCSKLKRHLVFSHKRKLSAKLQDILKDPDLKVKLDSANSKGVSCPCGMYLPYSYNERYKSQHEKLHCNLRTGDEQIQVDNDDDDVDVASFEVDVNNGVKYDAPFEEIKSLSPLSLEDLDIEGMEQLDHGDAEEYQFTELMPMTFSHGEINEVLGQADSSKIEVLSG